MNSSQAIAELILNFAKSENETLREKLNMGIFDMPELAFVYQVGKLISLDRTKYIGNNEYRWVRETDFGNGGPTDLAFLSDNKLNPNYAIEFKLDDTYHSYIRDIDKLRNKFREPWEDQRWKKYFCALKWVINNNQGDEFLNTLQKEFDGKANLIKDSKFEVIVNSKSKHTCLYTFWEVVDEKARANQQTTLAT